MMNPAKFGSTQYLVQQRSPNSCSKSLLVGIKTIHTAAYLICISNGRGAHFGKVMNFYAEKTKAITAFVWDSLKVARKGSSAVCEKGSRIVDVEKMAERMWKG